MYLEVSTSTILLIFELLEKKKQQYVTKEEISRILSHKDYQIEFKRYGNRLSKQEFLDYLLNFDSLSKTQIDNADLRNHHSYWVDFLHNLKFYKAEYNKLLNELKKLPLHSIPYIVKQSFPNDFIISSYEICFTCGIGASYGFPYKKKIYFDFLQYIKNQQYKTFTTTLNHELHHLIFAENVKKEAKNIEGYFVQSFASEGLAVKFINNAQGVISKPLYPSQEKNIDLDDYTMSYLNNDFNKTLVEFKKTITNIRNHTISSIAEIDTLKQKYWLNQYVEGQNQTGIPKLKQSRLYSFGNEIWGSIYDKYGLEKLYYLVNHPCLAADIFFNILKEKQKSN